MNMEMGGVRPHFSRVRQSLMNVNRDCIRSNLLVTLIYPSIKGAQMAVYIVARHMEGGVGHEHIAEVEWENRATGTTGRSKRATMVEFIRDKDGDARVANASSFVPVGVVDGDPPYIRTYADDILTDNLLDLPEY
jgi:hypothetical protein